MSKRRIKGGWYARAGTTNDYDPTGRFHFFLYDNGGFIAQNSEGEEVPLCGDKRTYTSIRIGESNRPVWFDEICQKCKRAHDKLKVTNAWASIEAGR